MIFSIRTEEGLKYPTILLDDKDTAFNDDAIGGYNVRSDVIENVKQNYGRNAVCVPQHTLVEEIEKRRQQ